MKKSNFYQYYVEGECEKRIVNALKTDLRCIIPGKVECFNVVQNIFTNSRLRTLKTGTTVILVYDTDTNDISNLQKNISFLRQQAAIINVLCIPQVANLEEELVFSCEIKKVGEITQSKTVKDFKRNFIACSNIDARLEKCHFSMARFWSRTPQNCFKVFGNDSRRIRLNPDNLNSEL